MRLQRAVDADAAAIAGLRIAVAERLTERFGHGPWSSGGSERGVLALLRSSSMFVVRQEADVIATVRLAAKKPWSIERTFFGPAARPIYLTDMAVAPIAQGRGIGAGVLEEARRIAGAWPADAIRLDAYDAPAGAGDFYRKCGFREVGRASYRGTPLIYFEIEIAADAGTR